MWTNSTTVFQLLESTNKLPVFVANQVVKILELTTTDKWNYVQTFCYSADADTCGLSRGGCPEEPLVEKTRVPRDGKLVIPTVNGPCAGVSNKIEKNNFNSDPNPTETRKQEATTITANFASIASTFGSQKYVSYDKHLLVLKNLWRFLAALACIRTTTGSVADAAELEVLHLKFCFLLHNESLSLLEKRKIC